VATTTARRPVARFAGGARVDRPDTLAVEEPLEIRLDTGTCNGTGLAEPFTVTMRTPGNDLELALGFLVGEGVVRSPGDVVSARHCPDAARDENGEPTHNVVEVRLRGGVVVPAGRYRAVSSACGICGTTNIDAVRTRSLHAVATDAVTVGAAVLGALPDRLRAAQRVFDRTGGLHAAGLFTPAGDLLVLREDVGRHNAVDKVVGWAFERGLLPLAGHVLQVSGRASFELVQKAWMAGCPVLAAVSAPSSLAVDLALEAGMTLVGFSRGGSFNVYAGAERVAG
jgi:FdhD protein